MNALEESHDGCSPHCTIGGGTKDKDMTEEDLKIGRETANDGKPKGWFQVFRNLAGSTKDDRESIVSKAIGDYFDKHYMANPLVIVEEGKNGKLYLNSAKSR